MDLDRNRMSCSPALVSVVRRFLPCVWGPVLIWDHAEDRTLLFVHFPVFRHKLHVRGTRRPRLLPQWQCIE